MKKAIFVSFVVILGTAMTLQAEFQVNTYTNDNQEHPAIAMDSAGNFVVVWDSKGQDGSGSGVYGWRFDAAGTALGSEFQINITIGGYQDDPDIAMDGEGNFVVVWEGPDGDGEGVYARLYSANGQPRTDEFLVNSFTADRQKEPRVAMNESGAFVIVWEWVEPLPGYLAHWHVMGRLYDAAGVPQETDFEISQLPNGDIPDVAMDESGDFVVAWQRDGNSDNPPVGRYVKCRMYNADGTPKGDAVQVTGGNYTYFSSIAMNSSGSFVITWSYHPDWRQTDVYAQHFDPDGNPISAPFMVNTYTAGMQSQSSAAMHDNGELVVVWLSQNQDGSSYGVFGQRYNSDGTPVDEEFQLNTYTLDNQWYPDIALSESGRFVVVWQSQGQDGSGGGIFAEFGQLPRQLTYYVDRNAAGANNGSSWADAFNDLQSALVVAVSGDEIRVAQGVYTPEGPPPDIRQASNPNPADGARKVSTTADLSWTAGSDATSHDIYFGTSNPPPFIGNQTSTTFDPGTMAYNTTYFWRIDEVNKWGTTTGIVWSFTTTSPGPSSSPVGDSNEAASEVIDREATFQLKNGLVIKGGYAGFGQPDPNARDIKVYETILSGDIAGDDGPDFANNDENSYHVVTGSGTDETAVLDGFTITAGHANGSNPEDRGAGMTNDSGSPTLTNCTFVRNWAHYAAGIANKNGSNPTLTNCTFRDNLVVASGGAVYNWNHSNSTLTNCTFSGNSAPDGAAMFIYNSRPTLTNCLFGGNSSQHNGGTLYLRLSSPTLTNCTFSGNSAGGDGGGMYNENSNPTVTNCTFSSNSATYWGGGMFNVSESSPTLANCILWGNTASNGSQIHNHDGTSSATVSYSDVQGGWPGTGNIFADPCFVQPEYFGPVSYWKFDEAGGTTAYDSVGYNHGTIIDSTWTTGQVDGALSFDGVDDYVFVPDDYSLDLGTHDLSFAFWFKTNESSLEQILTKRSTTTGASNRVWDGYGSALFEDGTVAVWFRHTYSQDKGVIVTSTTSYNDGNWHNLAGVYTRSANLELYVDGVPEGTPGDISYAENKDIDLTQPLAIGCRVVYGRDNDLYFNGTIDEVVIYDRVLFVNEIQQHYQSGLSGQGYSPMPDYHLLENSPCINAGDPDYIAEPNETDLDGKPRVIGGRIDMGAFEFNHKPVADAGPDQTVEAQAPWGATVTLDGSGSSDADSTPGTIDDIQDFNWYESDPCDPNTDVLLGSDRIIDCNLSIGEHIIILEVVDRAGASDTDEVTVTVQDTTPPDINCPPDVTLACPADTTPSATGKATAVDTCGTVTITHSDHWQPSCGNTGTLARTWTATDQCGNSSSCVQTIIVVDTTPPDFTFSVTPTMLWPPDHKMVEITPSWTVSDECDETPDVSLVSIVANEGDDTIGDGHTSNDIQIGEDGSIYLRSERSGTSDDRIYTITYQAVDDCGNTTVRSAAVSIPHDFKVLARIASRWLWTNRAGRIPEDLNSDGVVNLKDFAKFAGNWTK